MCLDLLGDFFLDPSIRQYSYKCNRVRVSLAQRCVLNFLLLFFGKICENLDCLFGVWCHSYLLKYDSLSLKFWVAKKKSIFLRVISELIKAFKTLMESHSCFFLLLFFIWF